MYERELRGVPVSHYVCSLILFKLNVFWKVCFAQCFNYKSFDVVCRFKTVACTKGIGAGLRKLARNVTNLLQMERLHYSTNNSGVKRLNN